jgi:replication fork protection complex subunit Tof1/Swi1
LREQGDKKYIMHKQSAVFKSPTKVLDEVKKGKNKKRRRDDELAPPIELTQEAVQCLRTMAVDFIAGGFNRGC